MKVRFVCSQCGTCCRFYTVLITIYDCERLHRGTGLALREFVDFYEEGLIKDVPDELYLDTEKGKFCLGLKRVRGECVFLKENRCSIHTIKPAVCKLFPLEIKYDEKGELKIEVVRYPIVNADYEGGYTDFGDVEGIWERYQGEYYYHTECLKEWNELPHKLKDPWDFIDWLEDEIKKGWGLEDRESKAV